MKEIYIYGSGGFGAEVADLIRTINREEQRWLLAGFFDDAESAKVTVAGVEVIGGLDDIKTLASTTSDLHLVLAFGEPQLRLKKRKDLDSMEITFPSLIHPGAIIGEQVHISEGNIINANAVISRGSKIGSFGIINFNAVVGHDVQLGSFCSIMGGAQIGGEVSLGKGTYVGLNASVLQCLSSGQDCLIAAGAVMNTSIGDGMAVLAERSRVISYGKERRKRNT